MNTNPFVKKIIDLNNTIADRHAFHKAAAPILMEMGRDKNFWNEVFKQNLSDKGYLQRKWTMYEIPFFYVFENDDFYLKVHLFVPLQSYAPQIAASAIHHHNNYLLSTFAAYGPGYETMLFEKNFTVDPKTKETNLKIREQFTQQERPLHLVDAWEPHVVINPVSLSATLVLWSPDKKRATDSLRSNPLLKAIKMPLRKLIYALGMDRKVGIAAKETYQFYVQDNKFHAVLEDDFFAPTRAQAGSEVDDYSIQTVFAFMQRMGFEDKAFIQSLKSSPDVPAYYHKWIDMFLKGETIPDTFAKETINVPGGRMTVEDIQRTSKHVNSGV
ncbi:MAG: hypothetical protein K0S33_3545 [Bacteroidetes bacterium]|jgi:hypothetical protein|nr:hypothetical protein [Bacteroidota bacterium]